MKPIQRVKVAPSIHRVIVNAPKKARTFEPQRSLHPTVSACRFRGEFSTARRVTTLNVLQSLTHDIQVAHKHSKSKNKKTAPPNIQESDLQSTSAFNNVLTKLFREKKFIDVEEIYKLMKRTELQDPSKGIRRDEESFMIMFKTYMKRKRVEKMINLVEDMKYGARIIPPAEAYRGIIEMKAKQGNTEEMKQWYKNMRSDGYIPTAVLYNHMISAFSKKGQIDEMISMFEDMRSSKYAPDEKTLALIMDGLGQHGRVLEAEEWFEKLKATGLRPDVGVYNVLIETLGKAGDIDRMLKWFNTMGSAGVQPDVGTYNAVLNAYHLKGDQEEKVRWMERMQEIGMQPDMWTTVSYYGARPWRELKHQEPPKTIVELLDHTDEALLARKRKTEAAKSTRERTQILKNSPEFKYAESMLEEAFQQGQIPDPKVTVKNITFLLKKKSLQIAGTKQELLDRLFANRSSY